MIVFVDQYSDEYVLLKRTLQNIEPECEIVSFRDDFWEPDIVSAKEYLVRKAETEPYIVKDLHNAFLDIPPYWHVMVEGTLGAIYDMDQKKATIYFREPTNKRFVERVEWLAEAGYVYRIDYYNKYGFVACRVLKNAGGTTLLKTYYSSKGEEILSHNQAVDSITLFENGRVKKVFDLSSSFEKHFYEQFISQKKRIVLTSVRQALVFKECDRNGEARACVLLNDAEEIRKYQSLAEMTYPLFILNNARTVVCGDALRENVFRLCYVGMEDEKIKSKRDALILTMSDRIAGIEALVKDCPDITFHIAANTQVSSKLLELGKNDNVKVYPQIKSDKLKELLDTAGFYLDINYAGEIYNAIIRAVMNHMLIFGFEDTLHNKYYVSDECVFSQNDCEGLIAKLHELTADEGIYEDALKKQKQLTNATLDMLASVLG